MRGLYDDDDVTYKWYAFRDVWAECDEMYIKKTLDETRGSNPIFFFHVGLVFLSFFLSFSITFYIIQFALCTTTIVCIVLICAVVWWPLYTSTHKWRIIYVHNRKKYFIYRSHMCGERECLHRMSNRLRGGPCWPISFIKIYIYSPPSQRLGWLCNSGSSSFQKKKLISKYFDDCIYIYT